MPSKEKKYSQLERKNGKRPEAGSHQIHVVTKKNRNDEWFLKHAGKRNQDRDVLDIRSAIADLYRLILGVDRAPKVRTVIDDTKQKRNNGTISKRIPGYESLSDCIESDAAPTADELNNAGLASILVSSWFFEENDLNLGNIGFNQNRILSRIDFDKSYWSKCFKFTLSEAGIARSQHQIAFPQHILEGDINSLPKLEHSNPAAWPLQYDGMPNVDSLRSNPQFIDEKFKTLLKISLLDREMLESIFSDHIESQTLKNEMLEHFLEKIDVLKNTILNMPEFRNYIIRNPNIVRALNNEFERYNSQFRQKETHRNDKYQHRRINITSIKSKFNDLYEQVLNIHDDASDAYREVRKMHQYQRLLQIFNQKATEYLSGGKKGHFHFIRTGSALKNAQDITNAYNNDNDRDLINIVINQINNTTINTSGLDFLIHGHISSLLTRKLMHAAQACLKDDTGNPIISNEIQTNRMTPEHKSLVIKHLEALKDELQYEEIAHDSSLNNLQTA